MAFVKRITLALMILAVAAPAALAAGANAGGVLVVHATTIAYTVDDVSTYWGRSGVGCGQDLPAQPERNVCPPYDPADGANPCLPTAANPTMATPPAGTSYVWYVMAAFAEGSCPRLKAVGFRFDYDPLKIAITAQGTDPDIFEVQLPSDEGPAFPGPGSGVGVTFPLQTKTSRLQEIYWFAGYAYDGAVDATWTLRAKSATDFSFVDDSAPPKTDRIEGFGKLGLGGTAGVNIPPVSPTEEISWGRVKATYGRK